MVVTVYFIHFPYVGFSLSKLAFKNVFYGNVIFQRKRSKMEKIVTVGPLKKLSLKI
jgi:hypothetical protein